jgi:hypothetical protein
VKPAEQKTLPTEHELNDWRESLRQEYVQSWKNRDTRCHWAEPEYNASAKRFAKFVAEWRARHGWSPETWDILGWLHPIFADPRQLLRKAEAACLKCGIDPRETTLSSDRQYRYLTNGEVEVEVKPGEALLGGDIDIPARWPEIDRWLHTHPRTVWSLRGVICELDGIDASGEPWSISALNATLRST